MNLPTAIECFFYSLKYVFLFNFLKFEEFQKNNIDTVSVLQFWKKKKRIQ